MVIRGTRTASRVAGLIAVLATGLGAGPGVGQAFANPGGGPHVRGVFGEESCANQRSWAPEAVRWCAGMALAAAQVPAPDPEPERADPVTPSAGALDRARDYIRRRRGIKSFAVIDTSGRLGGSRVARPFVSASVVKAMLLVAHLRSASDRGLGAGERGLLGPMIRRSGNAEATRIHAVVGDRGLRTVARAAGMRDFSVFGTWASAQITAGDQARLFRRLDRLVPARHRPYARELLSSVVREQSWGIPAAARPRWRVYFKGGWRPTARGRLVHQAGRLEDGDRVLSIAVLTDGGRSHGYGTRTIRGVTRELLSDPAAEAPTE